MANWREQQAARRREEKLSDYRCTTSERRVIQALMEDGWEVLNRGWPDFLATRGDEVRLIEVKRARNDRPNEGQATMFRALEKALGIKVEVVIGTGRPANEESA